MYIATYYIIMQIGFPGDQKKNLNKYMCLNSRAAVKSVSETCLDDSVKDALYVHTSNCSILYSDFMHCMMNNEERVRVASIIH
jgi:hypothetical protein